MAATTAAVILAVLGAGGSYAFLNTSAPVSAATTITSGTATVSVSPLSLPTTPLYPGATISAPVTVTNTGDVPLAIRVAGLTAPSPAIPVSSWLTVGLAVGACPAVPAPSWSAVVGTTPAVAALGATVPVGASIVLCVSVALSYDAPQPAVDQLSTTFGVTIDGIQA
ncbi:hypothetical protein E3O44_08730 [Cryobacterium algoricola]|uniref:DUF11 domain-containing protein n=1 Tax=Cryobacterium algoricola TaxID=1259183 RepID=A0ABY2IFD6_9MICO|nr:hypothetical protein [Cryobacterium algoricola]TFB87205.1 hypothetical protein E3O44_08730 [Cryobacterium algoricola]